MYRESIVNVFYDKRIGRFFVFEKVKEGFTVFPVSMSKEHLLFMLNYDGFRHMEDVLLAEQYAKLPRWTRNLVVAGAENS